MKEFRLDGSRKLYFVEVIDEDADRWVEWEWANNEQEILSIDRYGLMILEVRLATENESNAWTDGYSEASGAGLAEERMANWNGVAYAIESLSPLISREVFSCGVCERSFDFDKAATIGDFYLSVRTPNKEQANKSVLWHVCIDCSIK